MRGFFELVRRFRDDERGVFAVLFGVFAIVLIAAAGAVVDFTRIELARTKAQQALDSAALGLQPKMFLTTPYTEDQYKTTASALLVERLADSAITAVVDTARTNVADGTLHLEGVITVPTAFVALIGIPNVRARITSEATRKRLNLEIAMVLDNSGSMSTWIDADRDGRKDSNEKTRMENLILAARCATDVLLSGTTDCTASNLATEDAKAANTTNVKIGVVPFTEFVNVGTANKTATWMDQTGASSLGNDNFDSDDNDTTAYSGAVNRFALYDALTNVDWAGCVEARKQPYDTTDELPVSGDTLFTPEFAPDEPGVATHNQYNNNDESGYANDYLPDRPSVCTNKDEGSWTKVIVKTVCDKNANNSSGNWNSASCSGSTTTTTTQKDGTGATVTAAAVEPDTINSQAKKCTDTYKGTRTSTSPSRYTNTYTRNCSYNFSDRELQERLCKYSGNINLGYNGDASGPNQDCPFNDITPLTNTKTTILDAIKEMAPQGYTNIHQGAIWGYHMLSSTAPLTEAQGYDTSTVKVIILMTDGENTVNGYSSSNMNKADGYMAYGYPGAPVSSGVPYNGRIYSTDVPTPGSDAQVTEAMDDRALLTCTNAKAPVASGEPDKIVIYTIGLNAPNQKTIDLLDDCATDDDHSFFPTDPADLTATFKLIADQLSNLRLSK
jgi:Flp pilus assembly pilin Flp